MRIHTKETTWIQDPVWPAHQKHPLKAASSKQQAKQKYKPSHRQTGSPPHSALPTSRKTNNKQKTSTNLTLSKAYTNHWTNLRRGEIKRKKEFNLEAWEKETSNAISLKKKKKKERKGREILHKWRNKLETNKWGGNRQSTWKRIQNNNGKDYKKKKTLKTK